MEQPQKIVTDRLELHLTGHSENASITPSDFAPSTYSENLSQTSQRQQHASSKEALVKAPTGIESDETHKNCNSEMGLHSESELISEIEQDRSKEMSFNHNRESEAGRDLETLTRQNAKLWKLLNKQRDVIMSLQYQHQRLTSDRKFLKMCCFELASSINTLEQQRNSGNIPNLPTQIFDQKNEIVNKVNSWDFLEIKQSSVLDKYRDELRSSNSEKKYEHYVIPPTQSRSPLSANSMRNNTIELASDFSNFSTISNISSMSNITTINAGSINQTQSTSAIESDLSNTNKEQLSSFSTIPQYVAHQPYSPKSGPFDDKPAGLLGDEKVHKQSTYNEETQPVLSSSEPFLASPLSSDQEKKHVLNINPIFALDTLKNNLPKKYTGKNSLEDEPAFITHNTVSLKDFGQGTETVIPRASDVSPGSEPVSYLTSYYESAKSNDQNSTISYKNQGSSDILTMTRSYASMANNKDLYQNADNPESIEQDKFSSLQSLDSHELRSISSTIEYNQTETQTADSAFECFGKDGHYEITPKVLPLLDIKVLKSWYRKNSKRKPLICFSIAVYRRLLDAADNLEELYTIDRSVVELIDFDTSISPLLLSSFGARQPFPDKSLLLSNSPGRIDHRNFSIESYLQSLLQAPADEAALALLCNFLSNNTEPPKNVMKQYYPNSKREGYLLVRNKTIGGYKPKYVVHDGINLVLYDSPDGTQISSVLLSQANVVSNLPSTIFQNRPSNDENELKYAFGISEMKINNAKKTGSHTFNLKYTFCCQGSDDLKSWYDELLPYTHIDGPTQLSLQNRKKFFSRDRLGQMLQETDPSMSNQDIQAFGYSDMVPGKPVKSVASLPTSESSREISSILNHSPFAIDQALTEKGIGLEDRKARKKSFWGFRNDKTLGSLSKSRNMSHSNGLSLSVYEDQTPEGDSERPNRQIFGISLVDALNFVNPPTVVPTVVTRCIEYLDAKNAKNEEGIYRLSGSSSTIRHLRDCFNKTGDYNILASQQNYDIHAVAGLIKLFLREMPTFVLTRSFYSQLSETLEIEDEAKRRSKIKSLLQTLPQENYDLLATIIRHLSTIAENSDKNKMTVRNIGIVFSPTLNISATIFSDLLKNCNVYFGHGN